MRKFNILFGLFSTLTMLVYTSNNTSAATITAGLDDNFGGGVEPAFPSSELVALSLDFPVSLVGFDVLPNNQDVSHTFSGLPQNIVSANLELRVRATSNSRPDTDGIFITFADSSSVSLPDAIRWKRTFGDFLGGGSVFTDPDPGIATPGETWTPGSEAFLNLDLSALPLIDGNTINLLPIINSNGFLDVTVSDDSAVDFYRLNFDSDTPNSIPETTSILSLLVLSSLGTASLKRKQKAE